MTSDEHVVPDDGSAWVGSRANGTHAMKSAVGADVGLPVNPDRTAVTDEHARTDFSIRMEINESHN